MPAADPDRLARREALLTAIGQTGLAERPVHPTFDIVHLKEIHRRIFARMPEFGMDGFSPGEFRPSVAQGDWIKRRGLASVQASTFIVYSRMDAQAIERLGAALQAAQPSALASGDKQHFVHRLATLYAEVDYVHPFREGNSRTLRTYTRQLAGHAGYELVWERFNRSPATRDLLCIARDLAVNRRALEGAEPDSQPHIVLTMDQFGGTPDLARLISDIAFPHRAIAFRDQSARTAIAQHPELGPLYDHLAETGNRLANSHKTQPEFIKQAIDTERATLQKLLNDGREPSRILTTAREPRTIHRPGPTLEP